MSKPKEVLFLLMEFPPVNTTGNYRSLKFIKYLHEFGITPIVVTLKEDEAALFFNAPINKHLLDELPNETIVHRVHCSSSLKGRFFKIRNFIRIYFSLNDNIAKRWRPHLLPQLGKIISKHDFKAIYTSIPPFSSGILAKEISKEYNIPLIIDMRDLWAHFGSAPLNSYLHYKLMVKREASIFKHASKIIPVTPQMGDTIKRVHPTLVKSKIEVITNGFDSDLTHVKPFQFPKQKEKIVIGYVGSFYYDPERRDSMFKPWWKKKIQNILEYTPVKQDWLYRSPYFFLKTIAFLKESYPEIGSRISIEFVGKHPTWLNDMLEKFDLQDSFTSHGFVPKEKVYNIINQFDIFLGTSEKIINDEHYCLPSKLFDYIGLNKPILGFVTNGIQKDFIENSGLGVICNPDDILGSIKKIKDLVEHGKDFTPNTEYLETFQRKNLTKQLSNILNNIEN